MPFSKNNRDVCVLLVVNASIVCPPLLYRNEHLFFSFKVNENNILILVLYAYYPLHMLINHAKFVVMHIYVFQRSITHGLKIMCNRYSFKLSIKIHINLKK